MTDHAPDLDATQSRQARWGRHAFIILVVSLALIVIGFGVIHLFFAGDFAGKTGQREAPQAAQAFNGPPPQPRASDAGGLTGHSPPPTQSEPSASNPS